MAKAFSNKINVAILLFSASTPFVMAQTPIFKDYSRAERTEIVILDNCVFVESRPRGVVVVANLRGVSLTDKSQYAPIVDLTCNSGNCIETKKRNSDGEYDFVSSGNYYRLAAFSDQSKSEKFFSVANQQCK